MYIMTKYLINNKSIKYKLRKGAISMKKTIFMTLLFFSTLIYSQDNMLCMGGHWTEDEANLMMKEFKKEWDDKASWEKRADIIRNGIIKGMKLDKMPNIVGNFNPIIRNAKTMDGYIVENVAIESFPGFYISCNTFAPWSPV